MIVVCEAIVHISLICNTCKLQRQMLDTLMLYKMFDMYIDVIMGGVNNSDYLC